MTDPETPKGDIPSLYSLAAAGDKAEALKLIGIYNDYIKAVAINLQRRYRTRIEMDDLIQDGVLGLLTSLKSLRLNAECPTYVRWIEKNIYYAILTRIRSETRIPDSGWAPRDL